MSNECIEVHIHGKLDLAVDVQWLAVDSSFYSTSCGNQLIELAREFHFPIVWNPRFEIATDQVPAHFRGPTMVPLANHITPDGLLNAVKIGQAVSALRMNPKDWTEWGTLEEVLQYLKMIWHVLVTYGEVKYDR